LISGFCLLGVYHPISLEILQMENKAGEKEHLFKHRTGLDYQMYSSVFPG